MHGKMTFFASLIRFQLRYAVRAIRTCGKLANDLHGASTIHVQVLLHRSVSLATKALAKPSLYVGCFQQQVLVERSTNVIF